MDRHVPADQSGGVIALAIAVDGAEVLLFLEVAEGRHHAAGLADNAFFVLELERTWVILGIWDVRDVVGVVQFLL